MNEKAAKEEKSYLTEKKLGEALKVIFPSVEFVHNRKVPNASINNRPDYRSDELMLIVEFDGNRHYQQAGLIAIDGIKDGVYRGMGYKVVRIPYFVQLSSATIRWYFGVDMEWNQNYPHGFVDGNCVLGGDFNGLGGSLFRSMMNRFIEDTNMRDVAFDIIDSMVTKVNEDVARELEKNRPVFMIDSICKVIPPGQDSVIVDLIVSNLKDSYFGGRLSDDDIKHFRDFVKPNMLLVYDSILD